MHGYPVSLVVKAELSPAVNRIRHELRSSLGIDTIEVRQHLDTALKIRRLLGENRIVAMLLDRYLGKDRVRVEFFGRPAYFLRTPALMGYLTGAPLVPSFVYTRDDGRVAAVCDEPIVVGQRGNREVEIQRATQTFARVLESHIRKRPHCWYQFYPFWATQPSAEQTPELVEPIS
jgi:KDO2-lipid IV(A) lauroyltransferase